MIARLSFPGLALLVVNMVIGLAIAETNAQESPASSRIGKQFVHEDADTPITSVAIAPNGTTLIASNYPKNNIQVWDVASGNSRLFIDTPDEHKSSLHFWKTNKDFSRLFLWIETRGLTTRVQRDDEKGIVRAYPDSEIQRWDLNSGEHESLEKPANQTRYLMMSPTHKYLLSQELMAGTFFGQQDGTTRFLEIESGRWTDLGSDLPFLLKFDRSGNRIATFMLDESKRYVTGISVKKFPSLEETVNYTLPEGIHGIGSVRFCDNPKYLVAEYRTYQAKDDWSNWKTTIICIDLQTGERAGEYTFPFDNDSPLFLDQDLLNDTLVFHTWRNEPKLAYGLEIPSLAEKWNLKLGQYLIARESIVAPGKDWFATLCVPDSEQFKGGMKVDWRKTPPSELKVIDSTSGKLLETVRLLPGTRSIAMSENGLVAFGSVGSVNLLDISRPFENEPTNK